MVEIEFESLGLKEIPNASGKTIQFTQLDIPNHDCNDFELNYIVRNYKSLEPYNALKDTEKNLIHFSVNPNQDGSSKVTIDNKYVTVPTLQYLYIQLDMKPNTTNKKLENEAIITYQIS